MFFNLSKSIGYFLQPTALLTLLAIVIALLTLTKFKKITAFLAVALALAMGIIAFTSLNFLLLGSLEYRIEKPELPDEIHGIVVLGGTFDNYVSVVKQSPELYDSADRIIEAIVLAKKFPQARLLYSGSSNWGKSTAPSEAQIAKRLSENLGIPAARFEIETKARNTHENAIYSLPLADPKPGENWLLITSAFHMPRSYSIYRKVGWESIIPWPVDYRTMGNRDAGRISTATRRHFSNFDIAIREYMGLLAYWLTGRTDELFPLRRLNKSK